MYLDLIAIFATTPKLKLDVTPYPCITQFDKAGLKSLEHGPTRPNKRPKTKIKQVKTF